MLPFRSKGKTGDEMYTILLVDDEELVLKSLIHTVEWEKYGFSIIGMSCSGRDAYEKIMQLKPDLVMTDIRMQGIGGLELIQLIRQVRPETYFIILSGYAEFAYAQKAIELGAIGYCLKPFQKEEIVGYLNKVKGILHEKNRVRTRRDLEEKTEKSEPKSKNKNQTYLMIKDYVDEHYMEDVTPQSLAEQFHINVSYLSQLFKKESGGTYTEYLTSLRIKNACRLLSTSDEKIADIAERVGFHDYFYFTRVFKKVMDMSPSEYRGE